MVYKTKQFSEYFSWAYDTKIHRKANADVFYTQLKLFKFLKEQHENFLDDLFEDLIKYDLTALAITSIHLL